ncbi:serine hydrolase [Emticicia sp. C21]|uniref:serine hydrolase domain-containing protein n=1 Tax=Emticicia sp. C21 TaxID=2302915 RepID=UPI000E34CC28|nr:serine hydrolase domain-containing protein [Emticicia sp. C21]RFS14128.1 class A beta-lactamase-related serine hydrolase [Emticicia sp. C21]
MKKIMATLCLLAGLFSNISAQNIPQKLEELMSAYAQNREFNGTVLIAKGGRILLEKGYGYQNLEKKLNNTSATLYPIASITKTFTATLILKLAELKQLSLQDKLSKYYPDFPKGDSITIENLLTHTSGIFNYTEDNNFMHNESGKPASEQKILSLFKNKPLDFSPGKGWNYSNSGFSVLGYIIEKVTKMSYYSAIRKYLFTPVTMYNSGFDFVGLPIDKKAIGYYSDSGKDYNKQGPLEDSSVVFAAGAIYSSVGDLYKWHQALQNNLIISKNMMDKAYTPFMKNYGYGWIIDSLYHKRIVSHSGGLPGYRSNFARIVEDDVCIILLNNTEIPGLGMITNNLLAVLYNQPYKLPTQKKSISLDKKILERYVGTYEVTKQPLKIEFKIEDNRLVAYPFRGPRSILAATDESHFFDIEQEQIEISFEKDETGNYNKLILDFSGNKRTGIRVQ